MGAKTSVAESVGFVFSFGVFDVPCDKFENHMVQDHTLASSGENDKIKNAY